MTARTYTIVPAIVAALLAKPAPAPTPELDVDENHADEDHDVLCVTCAKKRRGLLKRRQQLAQAMATPESKRKELCKEYALEKAFGITRRPNGGFV